MGVEGCYESERMRETIYNKRGEAEEQSRVRLGTDWGERGDAFVTPVRRGCSQSGTFFFLSYQLAILPFPSSGNSSSVRENTRTSRHTSIRVPATGRYIQTRASRMPVGRSFEGTSIVL